MEVISYRLKDFKYRTPEVSINQDGEIQVGYLDEKPISIPSITFLYMVEMDDNQAVIRAKGVDIANAYLMHLVINNEHQCVSLQSRALIHFFSFLNENAIEWDDMPFRQNKRPTYRFKGYLESLYRSVEPESKLSGSTVQGYMRCIVNFYRHQLARGYQFSNPPFEHEIITVNIQGSSSSVQAMRSMNIQTTDLRIKAAKTNRKNGVPNRLIALSKFEWGELDFVLRKDRRILRNVNGNEIVGALAIEYSLIFLLMRYSGLRREEAILFKASLIYKPTADQIQRGYITFRIGLFCGVQTKYDKERGIEIPAYLMLKLHEYMISERYIHRRGLYEKAVNDIDIPLFLNNRGQEFSLGTLNARWGEIRNTLTRSIGRQFHHKLHNLRPTYGVFRLYSLIDAGLPQSDALTFLQEKMGHSDISSTLHYLKQVQEGASGDEKAEHVYEYLFNLAEFEI